MIEKGIKGEIKRKVTSEMTAKQIGSGELEVLATPMLISIAEECAWKSIAQDLDTGKGSVGTKIELSHIAASPIGSEIRCETELIEVDRRRLVFSVVAYDDIDKIAEGRHERFIVDNESFEMKAKAKLK